MIYSKIRTALFIAAMMSGVIQAAAIPLTDSAFVRSGIYADMPQDWSTALALKNAGGDNGRIAMMKADLSSITGTVDTATFTVFARDDVANTLYVYGVKDSAGFQNWTGDAAGNATWNSVSANGLFEPAEDLYLSGHSNLVLLGSQALPGSNTGDVSVAVSGADLVDLINNDTDNLLTFVCAVADAVNTAVRPHYHVNAPGLFFTYSTVAPPGFEFPLYGEAAQFYSNSAPYDLTQETYTFSTLWSTPEQDSINFLAQSYNSPIVTRGDDTFVLFVDTNHRMKISQLTNGVFKAEAFIDNTLYQPDEFYANYDGDPGNDVVAPDYYRVKFDDSHHAVALGIDEEGYLHLVGDMHNYPRYEGPQAHLPLRYAYKNIMYWRSDNPLDISSFSFKGDQSGECPPGFGFTYQFFFNDLNGKLHFTARAHQASDNAVRCTPFSHYDAAAGTWSIIGGTDPSDPGSAPRTFYDDGREYDALNPGNKYSKTHPHGVFDRQNNMHLVAPLLKDPTLHPGDPIIHFADTIVYATSSNGIDFAKADNTPITLPATINLTADQADIAYSTTGYLAVMGNIAVDYQNNPYTVAKHKYLDGSSASFVIGWNGTAWINHGNIVTDATDFRLVHDPAGVMSYIPDSDDQFYRFWHPTDTLHQVDLPASWPYIKMIDYEYLKKTGNILGLSKIGGELTVVKVEISNRPGMELIKPTAETPTNNPPKITTPATATGYDLSVTATDADGDPLTFTWYKYYGPGDIAFSVNGTAASSNTVATFSQSGTYELKVAVSDGIETRISACTLIHDPADPNAPKIISEAAAFPATIPLGETSALSVGATNTPAGGNSCFTWSKISGSGSVGFSINGSTASSNTIASFDAIGSYELTVVASNGYGTVSSSCSVTVEAVPPASANGYLEIDFSSQAFGSFVGANDNFDRTGTVEVVEGGAGVRFTGDLWKAFPIDYQMTSNTVIEFDFSCPNEGVLHAVAMTDTASWDFTGGRYDLIKLHGTGSGLYINDRDGEYTGGTKHYTIAIGQLLNLNTEHKNYLAFVNDDNKAETNPDAQSTFANVVIYEPNGDKDSDGQSNLDEMRLGTDPGDPASLFGISAGTTLPITGKFRIIWPSRTNVLYRIWESSDLAGWDVARDWAAALTPPEDAFEFDLSPSNGFFKIEADIL
ncbi:MAG: BNR-4 repeat-containing protein [Kiritimatiellales bacterium]|nr:BNR-4 repeat-containing protein [Kiritimatiellales bacterium]